MISISQFLQEQEEKKGKQEDLANLLVRAYKACFCDDKNNLTMHGELVFKDLMDNGFLNKSTAIFGADGHIDTHSTLMSEGKRQLVLHMIDYVEVEVAKILNLKGKYND